MEYVTRVTRQNIDCLAGEVEVKTKELYDQMVDAKLTFKKEQDIRWAYEFFRQDKKWYEETMLKIKRIRSTLPKDISPKEATIKMYGWIEKNGKKNLSMPMMYDKQYPEYSHAIAVEYILTNPDRYLRAINWN